MMLLTPLHAQRFPARSTSGKGYKLAVVEQEPLLFIQHEISVNGSGQLIDSLHSGWVTSISWGGATDRIHYVTKSDNKGWQVQAEGSPGLSHHPMDPHSLEFEMKRWTVVDGLPASKIRSLARTRDGFLWIGTVEGLARFDGVAFDIFSEENSIDLRENGSVIRAMAVDEFDNLWAGTERGIFCVSNGIFSPFPDQDEFRGRRVNDMAAAKGGDVWVGMDDGLARVGLENHEEIILPVSGPVNAVTEGSDGHLYFSVGRRIFSRSSLGGVEELNVDLPQIPNEWGGTTSWEISDLRCDNDGILWIGTNLGLWLHDLGHAGAGLMSLDPSDLNQQTPHKARLVPFGNLGMVATSESQKGGVLFRSSGSGYVAQSFGMDLAETRAVLVDDEGSIWFGGREGLYQIHILPCTTFTTNIGAFFTGPQTMIEDRFGGLLVSGTFRTLMWHRNQLTAGFSGLGASFNSPMLGFLMHKHPDPSNIPFDSFVGETGTSGLKWQDVHLTVSACICLDDGTWLAATSHGLYNIHDDLSCERVESAPADQIDVLAEAYDGSILMGVRDVGLGRLAENSFEILETEANLGRVLCLKSSDSESGVWVGTDKGVFLAVGRRLVQLELGIDLAGLSIWGITEDLQGRLWLNHSEGLTRIRLHKDESFSTDTISPFALANFGAGDGIMSLETSFAAPGALRGSDGRLWFLKRNGLVMVDPSMVPEAPAPKVFIKKLNTLEGLQERRLQGTTLSRSEAEHLRFHFTTTSIYSPERIRMEYQLEGYNNEWITAENSRYADYMNLGPGEYRFRVRARNHEGRWSDGDVSMAFIVMPELWQTPAFQLTCAAVLGGFLFFGWQLVQRRIQARNQLLIEKERTRIARDIHDQLGAALTVSELALDGAVNKGGNSPLQELRRLIWEIHPANDTLSSVVDFVANFSARYLHLAGIKLDLDLPVQTPSWPVDPEFRRNAAAMLKEILKNVVEHSNASEVGVTMEALARGIVLTVRDNGCGFDPDTMTLRPVGGANGGSGLSNLRTRTEVLGGECEIHSSPGTGTSIRVALPYRKKLAPFRLETHL